VTVVSGINEAIKDLAPNGVLRAAINLGNPVLAQGTPEAPAGVTVDIARELGARLGVPVDLTCFAAARESFEAMARGDAGICFLAVEPARAARVAFTAPYVVIEGVYVVPAGSGLTAPGDVDRAGVRVGVNEGSAYDLFLSRTLQRASVVRGEDGLRRRDPRVPDDRRGVHADPAGRRYDAHPRAGHDPVPGRLRRGPEGHRLHRRCAAPLRPGRRLGSAGPALRLSRYRAGR
jgi:hypothetical protein